MLDTRKLVSKLLQTLKQLGVQAVSESHQLFISILTFVIDGEQISCLKNLTWVKLWCNLCEFRILTLLEQINKTRILYLSVRVLKKENGFFAE